MFLKVVCDAKRGRCFLWKRVAYLCLESMMKSLVVSNTYRGGIVAVVGVVYGGAKRKEGEGG